MKTKYISWKIKILLWAPLLMKSSTWVPVPAWFSLYLFLWPYFFFIFSIMFMLAFYIFCCLLYWHMIFVHAASSVCPILNCLSVSNSHPFSSS